MKNDADCKRAKLLRWYGIDREFKGDIYWKYQIKEIGYKYHMNDVTATILDIQLDKFDKISATRNEIADRYLNELNGVPGLTLLDRKSDRQSGNWLDEARTEQIRAIVKDVLADARSHNQAADGADVGYNKGFYIQSADKNYKLVVGGLVQARYTFAQDSVRNKSSYTTTPKSGNVNGFDFRRARLIFTGNAFNYKIGV